MPFWLLVLILVTLIALCWGGGFTIYRSGIGVWPSGLLGLLGLILFIVLVLIFMGGASLPTGPPLR